LQVESVCIKHIIGPNPFFTNFACNIKFNFHYIQGLMEFFLSFHSWVAQYQGLVFFLNAITPCFGNWFFNSKIRLLTTYSHTSFTLTNPCFMISWITNFSTPLWLLPKYEVKGQVVGLSSTIQVNAPHKGQRIIGIIFQSSEAFKHIVIKHAIWITI
jgi:hypothetical protein